MPGEVGLSLAVPGWRDQAVEAAQINARGFVRQESGFLDPDEAAGGVLVPA
ncbi:hypothetical protein ACWEOO_27590 [Kribbella sp. NPDC004138]